MSQNTVTNQTLEQKRAEHALKCIQSIQGDKNDGYYVSYVSALPATIVMNGVGQALVTQLAKAKKEKENDSHQLLFNHVASWLTEQIDELKGEPQEVIAKLMKNDQDVYLRAQAETMAYLNWLKQFARAYLNEKEGQDG